MPPTDIEVDLDRAEAPPAATSRTDHPKRVVGTIVGAGVVGFAAGALAMSPLIADPVPAAAPQVAKAVCLANHAPPLPAFTINAAVAGDIPDYQDTGAWTWRQMLLVPADIPPGAELIELQAGSLQAAKVAVETADGQKLVVRATNASATNSVEIAVPYPDGAYGGWVTIQLSSTNRTIEDRLSVDIQAANGTRTGVLSLGTEGHAAPTGFTLSTPVGASPESEVKFGPPSFSTAQPPC